MSENTGLHTLNLAELRDLAVKSPEYSEVDLAIAWQLYDRLIEGSLFDELKG